MNKFMHYNIFLFLVLLFLLSGCSSVEEKKSAKENEPVKEKISVVVPKTAVSGSIPENFSQVKDIPKIAPAFPTAIAMPPYPTATQKQLAEQPAKNLEYRINEAYDRLHTFGSGQHVRSAFPDIELVYTDRAEGTGFPPFILPFNYYYSKEADRTFNICAIDLTVFICNGKLDKLITKDDFTSGRCRVTEVYKGDPRLMIYNR